MEKDKQVMTIKNARELRGYTLKQAAELMGLSEFTLGNYERGKTYPNVPVIKKMEKVYGVSYDQLIFLPSDYDKTVNMV